MTNNLFTIVRAIRGPIVLLTLGVLFAIDQSDGLSFRRTWPVLLVVFGVMKLFERLLAPPAPPAYYPQVSGTPQPPWSGPAQTPPPAQPGGQQS